MTTLVTPVGKVTFSQLEEPRAFKDQLVNDRGEPAVKKYSISVEFEGEDAKKLRLQLIEMGKAVKLVDGKLKVSFNRTERMGKPRMVGPDKKEIENRPPYLQKGTEVKVSFQAREFPMGVSLMLDAVMVIGDLLPVKDKNAAVTLEASAIVDKEFLDVF